MRRLPYPACAKEGTRVPKPRPGASNPPNSCHPQASSELETSSRSHQWACECVQGSPNAAAPACCQRLARHDLQRCSLTCSRARPSASSRQHRGWDPASPWVSGGSAEGHFSKADGIFPAVGWRTQPWACGEGTSARRQ